MKIGLELAATAERLARILGSFEPLALTSVQSITQHRSTTRTSHHKLLLPEQPHRGTLYPHLPNDTSRPGRRSGSPDLQRYRLIYPPMVSDYPDRAQTRLYTALTTANHAWVVTTHINVKSFW